MLACLSATINPNWYLPGVGMEKNTLVPQEADCDLSSSGITQTLLSPTASSCDRKTSVPASAVLGPFMVAFRAGDSCPTDCRDKSTTKTNTRGLKVFMVGDYFFLGTCVYDSAVAGLVTGAGAGSCFFLRFCNHMLNSWRRIGIRTSQP